MGVLEAVTERYEQVSGSNEFENAVKGGTTGLEQVRSRIALAENVLLG